MDHMYCLIEMKQFMLTSIMNVSENSRQYVQTQEKHYKALIHITVVSSYILLSSHFIYMYSYIVFCLTFYFKIHEISKDGLIEILLHPIRIST